MLLKTTKLVIWLGIACFVFFGILYFWEINKQNNIRSLASDEMNKCARKIARDQSSLEVGAIFAGINSNCAQTISQYRVELCKVDLNCNSKISNRMSQIAKTAHQLKKNEIAERDRFDRISKALLEIKKHGVTEDDIKEYFREEIEEEFRDRYRREQESNFVEDDG